MMKVVLSASPVDVHFMEYGSIEPRTPSEHDVVARGKATIEGGLAVAWATNAAKRTTLTVCIRDRKKKKSVSK